MTEISHPALPGGEEGARGGTEGAGAGRRAGRGGLRGTAPCEERSPANPAGSSGLGGSLEFLPFTRLGGSSGRRVGGKSARSQRGLARGKAEESPGGGDNAQLLCFPSSDGS